jgi:uncharacterized repeat protein (TIGR03843 family)
MPAPDSTDVSSSDVPSSVADEELLCAADLVVLGRMPWSSNATFLCELWPPGTRPDAGLADAEPADGQDPPASPRRATSATGSADAAVVGRAVYKPHWGERPLWDFPDGLYRREAGAYHLARAIGWDLIPPTVVRDGPFGMGSVQAFVEADFDQHYFTLLDDDGHHPQLRRMAAFDLVLNSTDRKGGHVLVNADGHLWGIDNGLCLHAELKLRTVIWDFAGEALPAGLVNDLERFLDAGLDARLAELLDPFEADGLRTRVRALLADGRLPSDPSGRRFPWPLV